MSEEGQQGENLVRFSCIECFESGLACSKVKEDDMIIQVFFADPLAYLHAARL